MCWARRDSGRSITTSIVVWPFCPSLVPPSCPSYCFARPLRSCRWPLVYPSAPCRPLICRPLCSSSSSAAASSSCSSSCSSSSFSCRVLFSNSSSQNYFLEWTGRSEALGASEAGICGDISQRRPHKGTTFWKNNRRCYQRRSQESVSRPGTDILSRQEQQGSKSIPTWTGALWATPWSIPPSEIKLWARWIFLEGCVVKNKKRE